MGLGDEKQQFEKRLRRLAQKERRLDRGYTTQIRGDGLLIVRPKRRVPFVSLRSMLLFIFAFVVLKAFVIVELGPNEYRANLIKLSQGTVIEQAGAWVMSPDPASTFVADYIRPYLR